MKKTINIGIDGMHCAGCSSRTEKALAQMPGVSLAHVNLALEEASLEIDDKKVRLEDIEATIKSLGFSVRLDAVMTEDEQQAHVATARSRMLITWGLALIITELMLSHMLCKTHLLGMRADLWTMFGLSLLIIFFPARHVYRSAWMSIKSRSANMDVLIALGTIASLMVLPLSHFIDGIDGHAFTGIAGMILAFHLTGRYLEYRARGKASEAIRKLVNLGAKTALILVEGVETEVPIHKVKPGDIFIVKSGMKIPTDGEIVEGTGSFDEAMATGESMPVLRKSGEPVIGGTINLDGYLKIRATRTGSDTFLAQVIRLVQEAQHSKVPIQVLADKVTAIFVPVILVLAALTFALWMLFPGMMTSLSEALGRIIDLSLSADGIAGALMASIAVLVIACPCALGLATPTALMVGSGIGASNGILIRNGEALQRMKDIRVIAFDKTGTLTHGKPKLLHHQSFGRVEEEITRIAASLEAASSHPLGLAIVTAFAETGQELIPVTDFSNSSGKGISAKLEDKLYHIGSLNFLKENGISVDIAPLEQFSHATKVWLADERSLLGIFYIADTIKPEAAEVIKSLKESGITPVMISGDNADTAKAIAALCGIERVMANVLPGEKASAIIKLRDELGPIAMVGDGINDAPALKAADIGIAMGYGTDIAIEAADITIVRSELTSLPKAIKLSIATFRKIRQNLFWAFFYNLIAIPLAILGLLYPVIAEIAMAGSSITVVTNANLLKRIRL